MLPFRLPATRRARAHRAGFTPVEVMMAAVIVGILAVASLPAFANPRARANLAKTRRDLERYARAESAYFARHGRYAASLPALGVRSSDGVLLTPVEATATGWSVRAVHPSAAAETCALFVGSAASVAPATTPGVISCR